MKGRTLSLLGIIAAAVGVAIILFYDRITSTKVVITGGILFVAAGLVNLIVFGQTKDQKGFPKLLDQVGNAAAIILGICMLVFQSTFTPLVSFIFGLLIAVCALWQFFVLAIGVRPTQAPGWCYIFPLALTGLAIYVFINTHGIDSTIMRTTGIAFAVLGLGCLVEGVAVGVANKNRKALENTPTPEILPEQNSSIEPVEKPSDSLNDESSAENETK